MSGLTQEQIIEAFPEEHEYYRLKSINLIKKDYKKALRHKNSLIKIIRLKHYDAGLEKLCFMFIERLNPLEWYEQRLRE